MPSLWACVAVSAAATTAAGCRPRRRPARRRRRRRRRRSHARIHTRAATASSVVLNALAPRIDSEIGRAAARHHASARPRARPADAEQHPRAAVRRRARGPPARARSTTTSSRCSASRGATVHRFADLLAGALDTAEGRPFVIDRTCTPERFGEQMAHVAAPAARRRRRRHPGRPAHRRRPEVRSRPRRVGRAAVAGARRRRPRAATAAEHAVPARQLGLDRRRRHRQPDGQAGPAARVAAHPRGLPLPPAVP